MILLFSFVLLVLSGLEKERLRNFRNEALNNEVLLSIMNKLPFIIQYMKVK